MSFIYYSWPIDLDDFTNLEIERNVFWLTEFLYHRYRFYVKKSGFLESLDLKLELNMGSKCRAKVRLLQTTFSGLQRMMVPGMAPMI